MGHSGSTRSHYAEVTRVAGWLHWIVASTCPWRGLTIWLNVSHSLFQWTWIDSLKISNIVSRVNCWMDRYQIDWIANWKCCNQILNSRGRTENQTIGIIGIRLKFHFKSHLYRRTTRGWADRNRKEGQGMSICCRLFVGLQTKEWEINSNKKVWTSFRVDSWNSRIIEILCLYNPRTHEGRSANSLNLSI